MWRLRHLAKGAGVLLAFVLFASPSSWAAFTGPTSPYYLDDYTNQEIYVVQGTSVVNSFPWAYGPGCSQSCEGNLAVTNVVSTNWFGSGINGPAGLAGQYTLSGTPTGTSWTNTPSGRRKI
jgi:hypothetical protein